MEVLSSLYFQVAIKIIDKTQLNPGSLQKVRLLTAVCIQFVWKSSLLCIIIIRYIGMIMSFSVLSRSVFTLDGPVSHSLVPERSTFEVELAIEKLKKTQITRY